jgi:hypothetical protein
MGSDAEASGAIESLSGREIAGRPINISEARARTPRAPGGGAWAGGGGGDYGDRPRDGGRRNSGGW